METMMDELAVPVGYSDHTTLPETPAFAVAAGASIVEKHFTLDSTLPGPDHKASLEPSELTRAVGLVRSAFQSRGSETKEPTENELNTRTVARKSLHAATDLSAGTKLKQSHIDIIRPADGLSPATFQSVLGTELDQDLSQGEPILKSTLK
jgi:N-acetylneuraminate synthase/N,N'-diacetyllegionaminate synthase